MYKHDHFLPVFVPSDFSVRGQFPHLSHHPSCFDNPPSSIKWTRRFWSSRCGPIGTTASTCCRPSLPGWMQLGEIFRKCGGFEGYPQSSSILDGDFPWTKPSSYWGSPFMDTPMCFGPSLVFQNVSKPVVNQKSGFMACGTCHVCHPGHSSCFSQNLTG